MTQFTFPSSSYAGYTMPPTISHYSASPSHYTLQILTLNQSVCSALYEQYRYALRNRHVLLEANFTNARDQYRLCLLNFKGKKMRHLLRDFDNPVTNASAILKEFAKNHVEFEQKFWFGYSELVQEIVDEYNAHNVQLKGKMDESNLSSSRTKINVTCDEGSDYRDNKNLGMGPSIDSKLRHNSYNPTSNMIIEKKETNLHSQIDLDSDSFCNERLSKYSDCLRKGKNGDSCQTFLTSYKLCKNVSSVLRNGALDVCFKETLNAWYASKSEADLYNDMPNVHQNAKFIRATCVDFFNSGLPEELYSDALRAGKMTFAHGLKNMEL